MKRRAGTDLLPHGEDILHHVQAVNTSLSLMDDWSTSYHKEGIKEYLAGAGISSRPSMLPVRRALTAYMQAPYMWREGMVAEWHAPNQTLLTRDVMKEMLTFLMPRIQKDVCSEAAYELHLLCTADIPRLTAAFTCTPTVALAGPMATLKEEAGDAPLHILMDIVLRHVSHPIPTAFHEDIVSTVKRNKDLISSLLRHGSATHTDAMFDAETSLMYSGLSKAMHPMAWAGSRVAAQIYEVDIEDGVTSVADVSAELAALPTRIPVRATDLFLLLKPFFDMARDEVECGVCDDPDAQTWEASKCLGKLIKSVGGGPGAE